MPNFTIVGKRFSPEEFRAYLAGLALAGFKPDMVVLHNTAVPSLKDRPNGFSAANMVDLEHYYGVVLGWKGGPHVFVDQNDPGIWVFNPLDRRGTHSPSFNSRSWGVEMLGDYATEGFDSGPGLRVQENAIEVLAAMFLRLGLQPTDEHFKIHREDPETTHLCPGKNVHKEEVRTGVLRAMTKPIAPEGHPVKVVVYRKGRGAVPIVLNAQIVDGVTMVDAAAWNAANLGGTVKGVGSFPLRQIAGSLYEIAPRLDQDKVYLAERA